MSIMSTMSTKLPPPLYRQSNLKPLRAEATYRSAIRVARDVVEDIGEEAASSSGGLIELGLISEHNSERAGHTLMAKKCGLSLNVPLTPLDADDADLNFPVLRLRDWAALLCEKRLLHVLVGLQHADFTRESAILVEFWRLFHQLQPDHDIFNLFRDGPQTADTTYPFLYHGDEGRGRRRQAFYVSNWHCMLGKGTLQQKDQIKRYLKLQVNFRGSSLVTRMLHSACPKKRYNKGGVFKALMESAVSESEYMMNHGVVQEKTGRKVFMATLFVCGDWPYIHKAGNLRRSFNNVPKRQGDRAGGICHKCRAGCLDVPWEFVHETEPLWLSTLYQESPFSSVPAVCRLLHTPGEEENVLTWDVFHAWHLGVGKSVVASAVALLSNHFPGSNIDLRFESLEAHFFSWCRSQQEVPKISRLTKETLQWPSTADYPQASWYKASVTTVFCKYLESTLTSGEYEHEPMLVKSGEAFAAINSCLRGLYSSDLFIPVTSALSIAQDGMKFLRRLAWLAKKSPRGEPGPLPVDTQSAHFAPHIPTRHDEAGPERHQASQPFRGIGSDGRGRHRFREPPFAKS